MNEIMKEQFESYDTETAMVLGVAGGNGLEHIDSTKYRKVFGADINKEYLTKVSERFISDKNTYIENEKNYNLIASSNGCRYAYGQNERCGI